MSACAMNSRSEALALAAVAERERQNRTAYRYGLCMVCLGVLLNWLGFYEHSLNPVRYLGLGCVLGGGILISAVMCRSLKQQSSSSAAAAAAAAASAGVGGQARSRRLRPSDVDALRVQNQSDLVGAMERGAINPQHFSSNSHHHQGVLHNGQHPGAIWMTKPPDYFAVVSQPPSINAEGGGGGVDVDAVNSNMSQPPPSYDEAIRSSQWPSVTTSSSTNPVSTDGVVLSASELPTSSTSVPAAAATTSSTPTTTTSVAISNDCSAPTSAATMAATMSTAADS